MAIVNRDLDPSQQMQTFSTCVNLTVAASAGQNFNVCQAAFPGVLKAVSFAAASVSGAPVVAVDITRWTAAGVTTIQYVSTTMTLTATGVSQAYMSISLAGPGSTLSQLQAGDAIVVRTLFSGGNVAAGGCAVTTVIDATQDIVSHFGLTS